MAQFQGHFRGHKVMFDLEFANVEHFFKKQIMENMLMIGCVKWSC